MSTTTTTPVQPLPPVQNPGRGPRWANRLALLITLLLVLGPLAFFGMRLEIAAWYAAAGQNAAWDKEPEKAIERYTAALSWAPKQPDYLIMRSEQYLLLDNIEAALADAKLAYEGAPDQLAVCNAYATTLVHAGQAGEAVKMWKEKLKQVEEVAPASAPAVTLQNSVAYFEAIANQDLDEALDLINKAMKELPTEPALLDTRGFVLYRQGKLNEALADMNAAIALQEKRRAQDAVAIGDRAVDHRQRERLLRQYHQSLAVMYYHRSLVFDALAKEADAKAQAEASITRMSYEVQAIRDREMVRSLGFKPDESLF